jgi:hypothetical protein
LQAEITDSKTTSRWFWIPAYLFLLAQIGVFGLGFVYAHGIVAHSAPAWIMEAEPVAFFGNWKMFTSVDRKQRDMDGYALQEGEWAPINLKTLFPSRWESGPRYTRKTIRRSGRHLRVLASATCGRLSDPTEAVRLVDIRWRSKLGQKEQPRTGKIQETLLIEWDCARPPPTVKGRPI